MKVSKPNSISVTNLFLITEKCKVTVIIPIYGESKLTQRYYLRLHTSLGQKQNLWLSVWQFHQEGTVPFANFDLLSKATLTSHFNFIILLALHFAWKCILWILCILAALISPSDDNTEHQEWAPLIKHSFCPSILLGCCIWPVWMAFIIAGTPR